MKASIVRKLAAVFEHALVFAGDLLPYGIVFLLTLMVGYVLGLEVAGFFSLAYAYVAIVTALVCSPNLLSLRRRMPVARSPGAVVAAALGLRAAAIAVGALLMIGILSATGTAPDGMVPLISLLFVGRFLETSVDGPATAVQYLHGPREYFVLRLAIFVLIGGVIVIGILTAGEANLQWIAICYTLGSAAGFLVATSFARGILAPVSGVMGEASVQLGEFGKFFAATALYLASSRLHPVIIGYFSGQDVAGQFAMVQNLFASLALASTGVASVFFWSRNRRGATEDYSRMPWEWLAGALPGGLLLGIAGGAAMDFLFLRPLGSSVELLVTAWILCLSTPLLLTQSILSNLLVLQGRDREMLALSATNALLGLLLMALLIYCFGLFGAALSVGASALLSSVVGLYVVVRRAR